MDKECRATPEGTHRGIGGFGYCTECGYTPHTRTESDGGWAVVAPSGAPVATTEPGEPREWAESYLRRLTAGGAVGYSIIAR